MERILEAEPTIGYIHAFKIAETVRLPNYTAYRSYELLFVAYK
jgi:hypothetical protein